jgi:hypothetical protein
MLEYAALVASPYALPDDLILVFQHPANPSRKSVRRNVILKNESFSHKKHQSSTANRTAGSDGKRCRADGCEVL